MVSLFSISCAATKSTVSRIKDAEQTLLNIVKESSLDYSWYSAKAKVRIESSELKGGGKMNIRMRRDSIIWFNFKKVSIEGARARITPTEYTLIYRTEKAYEKGSFESLISYYSLPFTFKDLQSFIAGNIPLSDKNTLEYKRLKFDHQLIGESDDYNISYFFDSELALVRYVLTDVNGRTLDVQLGKMEEELGIYKYRKLTFSDNHERLGNLELDLSNIEIDEPKKMPFTVPDHYVQYN